MTNSKTLRVRMLAAAAVGVLTSVAVAVAAPAAEAAAPQAASQTVRFNVPPGPLANGLARYADASGVQLLYSTELADGLRTQGVRGSFTREEALNRLLAGTGLTFRFVDERTVQIARPAQTVEDDGSRVLGPVRVEGAQSTAGAFDARTRGDGVAQLGGVRGAQDEEAIGYRARVATAGTGAPTALEDLPRTVSVVTQDQMISQDIRTMADVLDRLPGLTVKDDPAAGNDVFNAPPIYVRGFEIQQFQVDGGVARNLEILGTGLLNLNAYERIELVRGANGVFVGAGSPGGSLNLVRKRPGDAESLELLASLGSWGRRNVQVDYSTPSVAGSPIAFRGVASFSEDGAFYDNYDKLDALLYGIIDAPLGDQARLELGAQYGQVELNGGYSGVRHYADGPLFDVPRDWNANPGFAYSDAQTTEVFGRLYMEILDNLDFELGVSYQDQDLAGLSVNISDSLLSTGGGFGPSFFYASESKGGSSQLGMDLKLAGKAETFGLKHNFYIAGSFNQRDDHSSGRGVGSASPATIDDYLNPVFTPETPFGTGSVAGRSSQGALVLGDVVSWRDRVDLTLTLRKDIVDLSSNALTYVAATGNLLGFDSDNWLYAFERNDEWIPTWAITIKPMASLSIYLSQSSGFFRQDDKYIREGGAPQYIYTALEPVEYENLEGGVKYGRDGWLATLSYYRNTQTNVAEFTGVIGCPPNQESGSPDSPCYQQSDAVYETKGVDFEVAGELADGLSVVASYNWYDAKSDSGGVNTFLPEHSAKALIDWSPAFLPKWRFRTSLDYRSETFQEGTQDFYGPPPNYNFIGSTPFQYTSEAYLVTDIGASYSVSDALSLDLYVENLTDETYFRQVSRTVDVPGAPRSFTLTLRWKDLGQAPLDGLSPTNGLAPFGEPSDWYGAMDLGGQASRDMTGRARGSAQDGVTPVVWSFETEDKQVVSTRLGYRLDTAWRAELETSYRESAFSDIGGGSAAPFGVCSADLAGQGVPFDCDDASGGVHAWSLLFNVIHDFGKEGARFRPFAGLGLGVTRTTIEFDGKMEGIGQNDVPWGLRRFAEGIVSQDTDFAPTWQAQAGLSFALSEQATIDATYRYTAINDLSWSSYNMDVPWLIPALSSPLTPRLGSFSADYQSHSLTVGLRWAFGAR